MRNRTLFHAMIFVFVALLAASASAQEPRVQPRDPRLGQQEVLASIGMDPVDASYRTNYNTHVSGVLLKPVAGKLESKDGWHDLGTPAGVLVDIPKNAKIEPVVFTTPNGQKIDAVKVTLSSDQQGLVYACKNGLKPGEPMFMKLLDPQVEVKEQIRYVVNDRDDLVTRTDLAQAVVDIQASVMKGHGCVVCDNEAPELPRKRWSTGTIILIIIVILGTVLALSSGGNSHHEQVGTLPPCTNAPCGSSASGLAIRW